MPKKQAFIDKSGVKFVENFQKNQKIKKFPSRTEIRYLTAFMQKSQIEKITYTAVGKMIARSKNFDELLKFVEASHEDMLVDDIRFDVSSELRQTIEKEILEEAIASFRGKAETVAKGLGYEGFEVRNIDVNDSAATAPIRRPPLRPMMARAMTAERVEEGYAEAPPLEAGKQMVRVSVSGQIVLK
ncbi:SIMPL domain-containing protein [Oligella urethralis]|uniref:SIMPL domain-containing protein n=1 Tax=Oligella urethralis TaxID=90245 RepID=UPI000DFED873|nr:Predicted periplasmic/secreted protein [Oligella urethralis]